MAPALVLWAGVGWAASGAWAADSVPAPPVRFGEEVRPLLSRHCVACHGPDEAERQADFRIDRSLDVRADRGGYAGIVPGDPEESEVWRRITSDDPTEQMPPPEHGRLTAREMEILRAWIEQGADYAEHWAFVAPRQVSLTAVATGMQGGHPIDRFVSDHLVQRGLSPTERADRHRLIRRLALDLTGLPPSVERADQFATDTDPAAYEQLVDELLDSPSFGERWAAMWLDLARYADTMGYAEDNTRHIWPWRDWVIRAFNENLPYDQFTLLQMAGDLLPDASAETRLATAFHRNTLNNTEGGTNDEEFRTLAVKDRINTTLNVWMGLTMRCAECHSHKYDPISQQEYYACLDFFNQTADADANDDRPTMPCPPQEAARLKAEIDELREEAAAVGGDAVAAQRLTELEQQWQQLVRVPVLEELPAAQRRTTHLMTRGNYLQPAERVQADTPAALHPFQSTWPKNRWGLAQWLIAPDNPLTARVAVNRFWARLFGRGLVATEEDFGTQGELPSHPELLDWLAVEFQKSGWDVKHLLKTIVMSEAYQRTAHAEPQLLAADPLNRWLARGPRFRLSAEMIRDQALAVCGLLSPKMYGPPVFPPSPIKRIVSAFTGGMTWETSPGEDRYRRAIYTFLKRSQPHPLFDTFDMASREVCSLRRFRTNTPLQSFMTLNDEVFVEAAQHLAAKMADAECNDLDGQLRWGFRRALIRHPEVEEVLVLRELYEDALVHYQASAATAARLAGAGEGRAAETAHLAALTVVANVLLNLDEFLTK